MRYLSLGLLLLAGVLFPTSVQSAIGPDSSAAPAIPSIQQNVPASSTSRLKMDLFGWSGSNALSRWDGRKAKADGSQGGPIEVNNQVILSLPAFGGLDYSLVTHWVLQPTMGVLVRGLDPAVGVQGVIYENGGFSYWARYHTAIPVTESSRSKGLITKPEAVNSFSYRFAGTKIKLEAVIVPSMEIFDNGDASTFVYASPRFYYLMNDSFWLMSILETGWTSTKGQNPLVLAQADPATLGFGFRYTSDGGKGLYVQPFLNIFPFGQAIASTAHLGVIFGGPLL